MAQDTQTIQIIGRLGRDPETKLTEQGTQITTFSVACNNRDETTTWYNVSAFAKLGEICANYLTKGKQVFIAGDLHIRQYEKKDGTTGVSYDIRANNMQMLGGKNDNGNAPAESGTPRQPAKPAVKNVPRAIDADEDLPF